MTCGCIENHLTSLILVGVMASIPFMVYLYWKHIKLRKTKLLRKQMREFYGVSSPEEQYGETVFLNRDGID